MWTATEAYMNHLIGMMHVMLEEETRVSTLSHQNQSCHQCVVIGLFIADQNLRRSGNQRFSSAIYTRQNPNGNRRGYECPEERDYYPYWHPTPWRDIAVLADDASHCEMFRRESNNRKPKGMCQELHTDTNNSPKYWSIYNNKADCELNNRKFSCCQLFVLTVLTCYLV